MVDASLIHMQLYGMEWFAVEVFSCARTAVHWNEADIVCCEMGALQWKAAPLG